MCRKKYAIDTIRPIANGRDSARASMCPSIARDQSMIARINTLGTALGSCPSNVASRHRLNGIDRRLRSAVVPSKAVSVCRKRDWYPVSASKAHRNAMSNSALTPIVVTMASLGPYATHASGTCRATYATSVSASRKPESGRCSGPSLRNAMFRSVWT